MFDVLSVRETLDKTLLGAHLHQEVTNIKTQTLHWCWSSVNSYITRESVWRLLQNKS